MLFLSRYYPGFIASALLLLLALNAPGILADSQQSSDTLVSGLDSPLPPVVIDAAIKLGRNRNSDSVPALIALLDSDEPLIRRAAAWSLGVIGSQEAIQPLLIALTDSDSFVVEAAVFALAAVGSAEAVKPILESVYNESLVYTSKKQTHKGPHRSRRGRVRMIDPLDETNPIQPLESARYALGAIAYADPGAITPLVQSLQSESPAIRFTAARTLSARQTDAGAAAFSATTQEDDLAIICGGYRHFSEKPGKKVKQALKKCVKELKDNAVLGALLNSKDREASKWAKKEIKKIRKGDPNGAKSLRSN